MARTVDELSIVVVSYARGCLHRALWGWLVCKLYTIAVHRERAHRLMLRRGPMRTREDRVLSRDAGDNGLGAARPSATRARPSRWRPSSSNKLRCHTTSGLSIYGRLRRLGNALQTAGECTIVDCAFAIHDRKQMLCTANGRAPTF